MLAGDTAVCPDSPVSRPWTNRHITLVLLGPIGPVHVDLCTYQLKA